MHTAAKEVVQDPPRNDSPAPARIFNERPRMHRAIQELGLGQDPEPAKLKQENNDDDLPNAFVPPEDQSDDGWSDVNDSDDDALPNVFVPPEDQSDDGWTDVDDAEELDSFDQGTDWLDPKYRNPLAQNDSDFSEFQPETESTSESASERGVGKYRTRVTKAASRPGPVHDSHVSVPSHTGSTHNAHDDLC